MTKIFKVRDVATSDYDKWLTLWEGYNAFYKRIGPTAVAPDVTQTTWARFFQADEPVHCLVAATSDGIVGIAHSIFHRNTAMIAPTCYLQDLFTDPTVRNQGVGRALISEVYQRAKLAGSTRVYWQTHETNWAAQRLYDAIAQRTGFIVYRQDL
jgi:GNAT superfamily N-acetyltransferase